MQKYHKDLQIKMKYINRDNIRKIVYKNYLAFYIVNEDKRAVYVLRIRHGKTDWKEM